MEVNPEEYFSKKEAQRLLEEHAEIQNIANIIPIVRGSTNIIYRVQTKQGNFVLKISHRPDRNAGGVLQKEARILKEHWQSGYAIPIPQVIWEGQTSRGWPAILLNELAGTRIEDIIQSNTDTTQAAIELGRFTAQWHQNLHHEINEFETDRSAFPDFASYARHWLLEWTPLLSQATHVQQKDVAKAREFIVDNLHLFTEQHWPFVHADISKQNLLGKIENNSLVLTGLCDFETVQTAPMEYDIATLHDTVFLFYPDWEVPFLEGYRSIAPLPKNFLECLKVVNLFRSLRYIKRTVKYNETHYFDHDRQYFEHALRS